MGKVAVWINLGTAFYEAALYADARDAVSERHVWQPGHVQLRSLKALALGNVALCCLHMQEYEAGLDSIRDAVGLKNAPGSTTC